MNLELFLLLNTVFLYVVIFFLFILILTASSSKKTNKRVEQDIKKIKSQINEE